MFAAAGNYAHVGPCWPQLFGSDNGFVVSGDGSLVWIFRGPRALTFWEVKRACEAGLRNQPLPNPRALGYKYSHKEIPSLRYLNRARSRVPDPGQVPVPDPGQDPVPDPGQVPVPVLGQDPVPDQSLVRPYRALKGPIQPYRAL